MLNDLRFACRQLLKHPGFTAVAVLTLALGIGANTAIFSLVNELLLRPLPVKDAAELLGVVLTDRSGDYSSQRIPYPIYQDYRAQNRVFSELLAYAPVFAPLQIAEATGFGVVQLASANYFSGLGARPVLGRTFVSADDRTAKQSPVAVISHSCWQTSFGFDPAVLGKTFVLRPAYADPLVCTIIGVAAAGFAGLEKPTPQFWLPAVMEEHFKRSQSVDFRMIGRLARSVSRDQAIAELDVAGHRIAEKHKGTLIPGYEDEGIFRSDLRTQLRHAALGTWGAFKPQSVVLSLLGGVAGLGIYGVMSYLVTQRTHEIGVRMALGAQSWNVLGLVLRHGLRVTVGGLILGLLGALLATRVLASVLYEISPTDPLTFAAISWLLAGVAFLACCFPARRAARVDPMVALRHE